MGIITRPHTDDEADLLVGYEHGTLLILDLDGIAKQRISPPEGGWTHDALENVDYHSASPNGWDAYISDQWLGSSEV